METKMAIMEANVKSYWDRLKEHIEDVRALRGTWTMVTITIVGFLFVIIGVTGSGFSNVAETQAALMKDQIEIKGDMRQINANILKINSSIEALTKERAAPKL